MSVGRSTNRWMQYGSAVVAASTLLAVAACGSSSKGGKTTPSSSAPASASGSSAPATNASGITCNGSGTLNASGSTAQSNAISAWAKAYQAACKGAVINYGGGGSGKGVTDISAGTVDFAGSDFPMTSSQKSTADKACPGGEAVDLPMSPGGIALGYNLPGISSLNLSAGTLAKIFSGKVTKWDDPAIKADNPGVNLPSTAIQTFHRSDGSGTTYNFTNYLTHVAKSDWTYGFGKNWEAPGGQGSKGTQGIAQGVKTTAGGIGYMEDSFATQNNITTAKVGDAGGKFVQLTSDKVTAFIAKAQISGSGNDLPLTFDYTTSDGSVYPVVLVTYEITCTKGGKHAGLVKSFLSYTSSTAGQAVLSTAGYVPLPENIRSKVASVVSQIS